MKAKQCILALIWVGGRSFGAAMITTPEIYFKNDSGVQVTLEIQRGYERTGSMSIAPGDTTVHHIGQVTPAATLFYSYTGPTGSYRYSLAWSDLEKYGHEVLVTLTTKRGYSGVWYFEPVLSAYTPGGSGGGGSYSVKSLLEPLRKEAQKIAMDALRISTAWHPTHEQLESFLHLEDFLKKITSQNVPLTQTNIDQVALDVERAGLSAEAFILLQRLMGVYNATLSLGLGSSANDFLREIKGQMFGFLGTFTASSSTGNENYVPGQGGSGFKLFQVAHDPVYLVRMYIEELQRDPNANIATIIDQIEAQFAKSSIRHDIQDSVRKNLQAYETAITNIKKGIAAGKSEQLYKTTYAMARHLLDVAHATILAAQR